MLAIANSAIDLPRNSNSYNKLFACWTISPSLDIFQNAFAEDILDSVIYILPNDQTIVNVGSEKPDRSAGSG